MFPESHKSHCWCESSGLWAGNVVVISNLNFWCAFKLKFVISISSSCSDQWLNFRSTNLPSPVDSIRLAVFTVSPKRPLKRKRTINEISLFKFDNHRLTIPSIYLVLLTVSGHLQANHAGHTTSCKRRKRFCFETTTFEFDKSWAKSFMVKI